MDSGYLLRLEHEEYAKRMEEEHNRMNHRLADLEEDKKERRDLIIGVNRLAENMDQMRRDVKDMGEKIQEIESRDGEKWRNAEWAVIVALITGVVGFVIGQIF